MQCPACGAQYRRVAGERITLTWANPQKVVAIGASANPMASPAHGFRGYYLDQALSREEWERIAAGEEGDAFKRWAETSARYARGELPVIAPPDGVALREGESVHHLTRPAWLSLSGDPVGGMELQPGTFVVTSRHLLFLTEGPPYFLAWSRVGHMTESPRPCWCTNSARRSPSPSTFILWIRFSVP